VTGAHPGPLAIGSGMSPREVPSNAFPDRRSRSDPLPDRHLEYGSAAGSPQAIDTALARPATGPIPGSAIRTKVNRFCRI